MNYVFKRKGGPIVKWTGGVAPTQSRAADTVALGCAGDCGKPCCGGDAAKVPRPGAPEYIDMNGYVAVGDENKAISALDKIDDAVHSGAGRSVAMAANAFHGYRRNGSVMWALAWAALGYVAPVTTTVIATAQGFGHKKGH